MKLKPGSRLPGSTVSVGAELLRVHKNYRPELAKVPDGIIKGLAHITGGGLIDNLPRILPKNCDAVVETKRWKPPRIFQILQRNGDVDLARCIRSLTWASAWSQLFRQPTRSVSWRY